MDLLLDIHWLHRLVHICGLLWECWWVLFLEIHWGYVWEIHWDYLGPPSYNVFVTQHGWFMVSWLVAPYVWLCVWDFLYFWPLCRSLSCLLLGGPGTPIVAKPCIIPYFMTELLGIWFSLVLQCISLMIHSVIILDLFLPYLHWNRPPFQVRLGVLCFPFFAHLEGLPLTIAYIGNTSGTLIQVQLPRLV